MQWVLQFWNLTYCNIKILLTECHPLIVGQAGRSIIFLGPGLKVWQNNRYIGMLSAARFSNLTQLKRVVIPISPYNKSSRNKACFTIGLSRNHNDVTKVPGSFQFFYSLVHWAGFLLKLVPLVDTGWLLIEISTACYSIHIQQDREAFPEVVSNVIILFPPESSGKFFI